jgi:RNA-binding protein 39
MAFSASKPPPANYREIDMSVEERDRRTIFILQLGRNTRPEDLEDFFSSIGHVRDVRIITDSRTRRSKGIAYVEFWDAEAIPLAMGLNGQKLLGCPLVIQQTCSERNRQANGTVGSAIGLGPTAVRGGPLKLCINNLHPSITQDMLKSIFDAFGRVSF